MTRCLTVLLVLGWLCVGCSLVGRGCVSAQASDSLTTAAQSAGGTAASSRVSPTQLAETCRADQHCSLIETDGTGEDATPLFLQSVTNERINTIVLTASRYVLKTSAWEQFRDEPFVLKRNLTVLSAVVPYGLLDFKLMERRILISSGVTVMFRSIVLQNIRKLGGWAVDFFVGDEGSQLILRDVVRVKLACQLPTTTIKSASNFQRVSPVYPPNNLTLWNSFCFDAAVNSPTITHNCYKDVLHFNAFSNIAASDDPNLGRQYAGYVLFQENTTRVCQSTITQQCIDENEGDEELCLVMLVTAAMQTDSGKFHWTRGAIAGVAVAGAVVAVGLCLCIVYRNHILLGCVRLTGKTLQDLDSAASKDWVMQHAIPLARGELEGDNFVDDPTGGSSNVPFGNRRAISQQVTLGVLLGAGSFGRVYRGRWHSSDVAIKIMSCTPAELPKVLKEAEVMMQLSHPNVVKAFHASVWNPQEQVRALKAREARTSGSNNITGDGTCKYTGYKKSARNTRSGQNSSDHLVQYSGSTAQSALTTGERNVSSTSNITPTAAVPAAAAAAAGDAVLINVAPQIGEFGLPRSPGGAGSAAAVGHVAQQWYAEGPNHAAAAAPALTPSSQLAYVNGVAESSSNGSSQQLKGPSTGSNEVTNGDGARGASPITSSGSSHGAAAATKGQAPQHYGPRALGEAQEGFEQQQHLLGQQTEQPAYGRGSRHGSSEGLPSATYGPASPGLGPPGRPGGTAAAAAPYGTVSAGSTRSGTLTSPGSLDGLGRSNTAALGSTAGFRRSMTAVTAGLESPGGLGPGMAILNADELRGSSNSSGTRTRGKRAKGSDTQRKSSSSGGEPGQEVKRTEVQVWIVLELCTGGTLKDAVTAGKLSICNTMEMGKLLSRLLDAAKGMAYLHSKGIMHGDLKAGNVLLQNIHNGCDQVAKISDFGLATVLLEGATHRSTASMGTITHMAPEVLRSGHISPAADVYSFAIMMWEVLTNKQAHHGVHYGAVVERVVIRGERPKIPDDIPEGFSILMNSCWDADPDKRPTFEQIVTCLELMLDNLSDAGSTASGELAFDPADATVRTASTRSGNSSAAAAVANHLQQAQQQQQPMPHQAGGQLLALRAVSPSSQASIGPRGLSPPPLAPIAIAPGGASSAAGSQQQFGSQQPSTPLRDLHHPVLDRSLRTHDSSTLHSTQSGSRGSRPVSQSHLLGQQSSQLTLDANPFVQDL